MRNQLLMSFTASLLVGACGGSSDGGGSPGPTQTLASISVNPTSIPNLAAGGTTTITVTGTDTEGKPITTLSGVTFSSLSTTVADVFGAGQIIGISAGSTSIGITASFNGTTKTASVPVTVSGSLPLGATITGSQTANVWTPQVAAIARTGTVTFAFLSVAHSVIFSGSGAPGNIGQMQNATVPLTFAAAGNFAFECGIHPGMTGLVIVR